MRLPIQAGGAPRLMAHYVRVRNAGIRSAAYRLAGGALMAKCSSDTGDSCDCGAGKCCLSGPDGCACGPCGGGPAGPRPTPPTTAIF
ncbi:MAG: hypothetical protein WD696_15660 [Bryobacteraceae bacterium]